MADQEDIGVVAELIGKTLQWAVNQVEGVPAIYDVEWRDLGEIDFTLLPEDTRYRMVLEVVTPEANYTTTTAGMRGHYAVLVDGETSEPIQTGSGSYATQMEAAAEARDWAAAEGLQYEKPEDVDFSYRGRAPAEWPEVQRRHPEPNFTIIYFDIADADTPKAWWKVRLDGGQEEAEAIGPAMLVSEFLGLEESDVQWNGDSTEVVAVRDDKIVVIGHVSINGGDYGDEV